MPYDFNPRKAALADLLKELDDSEVDSFKKSNEPAMSETEAPEVEVEVSKVAPEDAEKLKELLAKLGIG